MAIYRKLFKKRKSKKTKSKKKRPRLKVIKNCLSNLTKTAAGIGFAISVKNSKLFQNLEGNFIPNSDKQIEVVLNNSTSKIEESDILIISDSNNSGTLKTVLALRNGDLSKSGPGARARSDARNIVKGKQKHKGLVTGSAHGFTPQHVYRRYHGDPHKMNPKPVVNPTEDLTPPPSRQAPNISPKPNRQERIDSQPVKIQSDQQERPIKISPKDINKWITAEDRAKTPDQKVNEKNFQQKIVNTVEKPTEALDGIHVHQKGRVCKVYLQKKDNGEQFAVIADAKTGRGLLASDITKEEYTRLKKTGEIDLSDFRRDPQTLAMNQKSVREADVVNRAKDQGCLKEFKIIRRPYNLEESKKDFVAVISDTSELIDLEIKGLDGSKHRPIDLQTLDINRGIKTSLKQENRPIRIICDISAAPSFLHRTLIKNILQDIPQVEYKNINFLFD